LPGQLMAADANGKSVVSDGVNKALPSFFFELNW
jgi:hypothetical protein